jgi:hypothetical protein
LKSPRKLSPDLSGQEPVPKLDLREQNTSQTLLPLSRWGSRHSRSVAEKKSHSWAGVSYSTVQKALGCRVKNNEEKSSQLEDLGE